MSNSRQTVSPALTLLVPCYNEEAVIPVLLKRLAGLMDTLDASVRVLFIDDGSRDSTETQLKEACARDPRLGYVRFSRNFGHQAAVSAGLRLATGDAVAVLDADLQDPPELIGQMLAKWREGYDVIYGIREKRKEPLLLRLAYAVFYRMLRKMANVDIPLDAGDFCLMDRNVVDEISRLPEHNRFIRGLRSWVGFKQCGLTYDRQARQGGASKYTTAKLFRLAMDGLIPFSIVPLRLASWMGSLAALGGFLYAFGAVVYKLWVGQTPPGWASLVAALVFLGGLQLLVLGIIGEYLGRVFDEVRGRPDYILADRAGWVTPPQAENG